MSAPRPTNLDPGIQRQLGGLESFSQTYAESTFRRCRSEESNDKLIRKIDMIAEEFIGAIHRENKQSALAGRAKLIACAKGCAHCCHQAVGATIPEVLHVASYVREKFTSGEQESLMKRLQGYLDAKRALGPGQKIVHACPFLVDDACCAFEARPLKCRGFNSLDVEACIKFKDAPGKESLPCSTLQLSAADALIAGLRHGLVAGGLSDEYVEFAPALQIALEMTDAAERYFAGEPIFAQVSAIGLAG